jgi:hypothetical protein
MKRNTFLFALTGLVLAACGSDGGGDIPPVDSPPLSLMIDSDNAALVAKVAYQAARDIDDVSELDGALGLVASGPAGIAKVDSAIGAAAKPGNTVSSVPIPKETVLCAQSGEVDVSGQIEDPVTPTLTAGDFFEFAFRMCNDGGGVEIDGGLRADVTRFDGEFPGERFDLGMTYTLTTLQVSEGTDVFTSSGNAHVDLDTLNMPFISTGINGSTITIDENTKSATLTNYSSALTIDENFDPAPYTMTASGTVESTELTGVVSFATPVMFQGLESEYPGAGEFVVEGKMSGLRLVAENNVDVTIYLDLDGDGMFDDGMIVTTWLALLD